MNELTLSGLIAAGNSEHTVDVVQYMAVNVSVYGAQPETIINPRLNMKSKLEYLATAYNEDLTLKTNDNIKIVKYAFVETAEELVQMFS